MNNAVWVWVDLEMTGLDFEKDRIIEISCILTRTDLKPIGQAFSEVIHCPKEMLASMSSWCIEHHGASGLTEAVAASKNTIEGIDAEIKEYITSLAPGADEYYLVGNSIHTDRSFIKKYMPVFEDMLHYRMIDVTAIGLFLRSFLEVGELDKEKKHRAIDDILESMQELKLYKKTVMSATEAQ